MRIGKFSIVQKYLKADVAWVPSKTSCKNCQLKKKGLFLYLFHNGSSLKPWAVALWKKKLLLLSYARLRIPQRAQLVPTGDGPSICRCDCLKFHRSFVHTSVPTNHARAGGGGGCHQPRASHWPSDTRHESRFRVHSALVVRCPASGAFSFSSRLFSLLRTLEKVSSCTAALSTRSQTFALNWSRFV